jgi:CRP-like cAMP-binding protein
MIRNSHQPLQDETKSSPSVSDVLMNIPFLAGLSAPMRAMLAAGAHRRQYLAGEVLFWEGEPCKGIYLVESGWLKAQKSSTSGRSLTMRIIGPGEAFAEFGAFLEAPHPTTVTAFEPAQVWLIRREVMLSFINHYPELARTMINNLAERILYLSGLVEDLSLRPVEARLARMLLEQAQGDVVNRRRWATQAEMSARLGTVPDVLRRALRSFADLGLIRIERSRITLLNCPALQARALLSDQEPGIPATDELV